MIGGYALPGMPVRGRVTPGRGLTGIARNLTVPQEVAMLPRMLLVLMTVALGLISLRGVAASTPAAGQADCWVEPRTTGRDRADRGDAGRRDLSRRLAGGD